MIKIKFFYTISLLFFILIALEIISYIFTKNKLFLFNDTPGIYSDFGKENDLLLGITEKDSWGTWHIPNQSFRHNSSCFDVIMNFNEIGARDSSFKINLKNSIILLGDSFALGFGVNYENTSQYILEKLIDRTILNFGAAGNFGPLQELLIYKEFKNKISHNGLLIYIFPTNDFTDNDRKKWNVIHKDRYRPYFGDKKDPLNPYYFPEAVPKEAHLDKNRSSIKSYIKYFFWSSNAIRTAIILLQNDHYLVGEKHIPKSYYYYKNDQEYNFVLAHKEIAKLAEYRDVLFVIIPAIHDIKKHNEIDIKDSHKQLNWYVAMNKLVKNSSSKIYMLDLLDYIPNNYEELFHNCDGHWSNQGNIWAANILSNFIEKNNIFKN